LDASTSVITDFLCDIREAVSFISVSSPVKVKNMKFVSGTVVP